MSVKPLYRSERIVTVERCDKDKRQPSWALCGAYADSSEPPFRMFMLGENLQDGEKLRVTVEEMP